MFRRLFVYGTLAPDRAPDHLRDVTTQMVAVGPAWLPGALFDLGLYPGALLEEAASHVADRTTAASRVVGHVFQLPDDESLWGRLDDYEGVNPSEPAAGLFRRLTRTARLEAGGAVECEVYVYNGSPDPSRWIADGRWRPPAGRCE